MIAALPYWSRRQLGQKVWLPQSFCKVQTRLFHENVFVDIKLSPQGPVREVYTVSLLKLADFELEILKFDLLDPPRYGTPQICFDERAKH